MKKLVIFGLTLISLVCVSTLPALAAGLSAVDDPVKKFTSLGGVIQEALPIIFTAAAFLALGIFMLGALKFIVSHGDPKATEGARNTMTGAVIGLVIVLGTVALSGVLEATLGLSLFGSSRNVTAATGSVFDLKCAFLIGSDCVGSKYGTVSVLVTQILLLLTGVGALAFFFMLLWGGIRYLTARGDDKAVSAARSTLTSAFIGFLLLITSYAIIRLLASQVFGFTNF